MNERYTVEVRDEYGDCDYAMFESMDDALACAYELDIGLQAKVIDRREQAIIWDATATES